MGQFLQSNQTRLKLWKYGHTVKHTHIHIHTRTHTLSTSYSGRYVVCIGVYILRHMHFSSVFYNHKVVINVSLVPWVAAMQKHLAISAQRPETPYNLAWNLNKSLRSLWTLQTFIRNLYIMFVYCSFTYYIVTKDHICNNAYFTILKQQYSLA